MRAIVQVSMFTQAKLIKIDVTGCCCSEPRATQADVMNLFRIFLVDEDLGF